MSIVHELMSQEDALTLDRTSLVNQNYGIDSAKQLNDIINHDQSHASGAIKVSHLPSQ